MIKLKCLWSFYDKYIFASIMYEVIKHYGFTKILGYVILDNTLTNNILVNVLINYLNDIDMDWDLKQYCICCFG